MEMEKIKQLLRGFRPNPYFVLCWVFILLLASSIWAWRKNPVTNEVFTEVPKIVTKVKYVRVPVAGGKIQALEKEEVVKQIPGLPETIINDDKIQITSTGKIAPYEGQTHVVNVLDVETGVSNILAKQVPLGFFGLDRNRAVGFRALMHTSGNPQADIFVEWGLIRLGRVNIELYGEGNIRLGDNIITEGKAGIQGKIKF